MARATRTTAATASWTWSAVAAGVIASLVVQVILTMVGFGFGLVSFDVSSAQSSGALPAWIGFAWWALSGIFAAAVGGWVAGTFSPTDNMRMKAIGGVTAWAIATLIVVGVSGITASVGASTAGQLGGPVMNATRNYQTMSQTNYGRPRETVGTRIEVQTALDDARKQVAIFMLLSSIALVLGAFAAYYAGMFSEDRRTIQRV
jgi:hypothetical protein